MSELRKCRKCNETLPESSFVRQSNWNKTRKWRCKGCDKKYLDKLKEERAAAGLCRCGRPLAKGRKQCSYHIQLGNKSYEEKRKKGLCSCGRPSLENRVGCAHCRDVRAKWVSNLRAEIFAAYGGKCSCPCGCPVTEPYFLTIDHINGGGSAQRKKVNAEGGGPALYLWLKRNNFPKDEFRLLCWNCNCSRSIRGRDGRCPLERKRKYKTSGDWGLYQRWQDAIHEEACIYAESLPTSISSKQEQ